MTAIQSQPTTMTLEQALQQAINHHRNGQLQEAERMYRAILQAAPNQPDANHNLGALAMQVNQPTAGLPFFKAAMEANPAQGAYWLSYIEALLQTGQVDMARMVLEQGRQRGLQGNEVDQLARQLAVGETAATPEQHTTVDTAVKEAEPTRKCGRGKSGASEKEKVQIAKLFRQARHAEVEIRARDLTVRFPHDWFGWQVLGTVLMQTGRLTEFLETMQRAADALPDNTDVHTNLGGALWKVKRFEEAERAYRRVLEINPKCAEVQTNLGVILKEQGRIGEAEVNIRQALAIKPNYAEAHNNLGNILKEQARFSEAEACYRQSLKIKPDYPLAHQNLSFILAYLSDFRQVVVESNKAFQLKPDDEVMWEERLYSFSYHPDLSAEEIFAEFVRWGDRFPLPAVDFSAHDRNPGRRLRVGYVSPDFRRHTSRFYFMPLFANHDKTQVELYAYSNVKIEDEFTNKFKGVFDHWRNIRGLSREDAAAMIKADGIDILVDCCNHMQDERLDIFTLKPAPIQVSWLGAAWTTGLAMVDYVLFDPYMAPEGTLTREEIIRLPHFFVAYQPPEETAEVKEPPCLKNGFITFGYSGRTERLNHKTFRVWGEILRQVPDAKLLLDFRAFADPPTQEHYRKFMQEQGMDPDRVIMRRSENIFEGLGDIDILLDCFPHSGGTMLFDALWMGLPALTLASRPPVGRIGTSLMTNLGLPEWVAQTEEEYIAKAVAFAAQPDLLSELRRTMRQRMQASPVMDGKGFTQAVENAYKEIWGKWTQTDAVITVAASVPSAEEINQLVHLFNQKDYANAELLAKEMIYRYPNHGFGWKALGTILLQMGRLHDAVTTMLHATELLPEDCELYSNLGSLFRKLKQFDDAITAYQRALALKPDHAEAYNNLGGVYKDQRRLVEAEQCYRKAVALKPTFVDAHQNLSLTLAYLSTYGQVVSESNTALALRPSDLSNWGRRLYAFSYHPDLSAEEIFGEFVRWGDRFPVPAVDFSGHDRTPGRRLRVGYVSPDFRRHTSRFYFMPLFANHDKTVVELFAYSNVKIEDDYTERFKSVFDHWRNIRGRDDGEVAAMVKADQVDILVDCCNHMQDNRLEVFALRSAPIQVTWLGAAWTTGLPMVDYVLFDPYIAPEGTLTREEIIRLPHFFVAYQPPEETAEVKAPPCLHNDFITFGYSGRTERLNHKTFRVWGEILRRIPDARLILDYKSFSDPPTQEHYRTFMQQHGMDPGRVIMRKSENIFEGLGDIDILLDCFPHSGGTMLFDALWMGVPALTLASRPPVGRIGTSLMTNLGLPEWVAQTEEEYIAKAVAFAAQPNLLSELRSTMRQRMQGSPVMDGKGFAKGVEQAYRTIWQRWKTNHSQGLSKENDAAAFYRRGNDLVQQCRFSEAESAYRHALEINPGYAESHNNLAGILRMFGKLSEAESCLRRVLELKPTYVDAYNNLGLILKDRGMLSEARIRLAQALELRPDYAEARQNLSTLLAYLSEFDGVVAESNIALQLNPEIQHLWEQRLYAFSYHPDLSAEEIFGEFVRWGDRFPMPTVDFSSHDRTPGRRLRVGYVSPDFRRHTSRFYFMPLFANHDKAQVELFAYSNVNIEDGYTEKFRGIFDHWRNIRGVSKEDAAAQIKADGIDILVDCCNHMADDRLDIFTIKPAPIQVTWLGAAWTTGLAMVDYVLFDPYIAPEGTLTREEIIRLPHFFVAYQPPEETAEVKKPPCLKNGFITFGYSGRTERLNHKTFRVWGEILRQVPDARLILDYKPFSDPPTQEHYRRFMTEHGMDPERVIMRKSENIFEGLGDIDILLDCFPHSGGTMLFDALWMGVPVLTLASRPPVGRIGTSLMTNLGLPEWVAQTEEEYIAKAVSFAAQPDLLSELRRTMRQRMQGSPVMDGKGFAQGVEQAYREIWRRWLKETD